LEISVLAVGRMKAGPERELCERYLERARKSGPKVGLRGFAVDEIAESHAGRAAERIAAEDVVLAQRLKDGDRIVCLDIAGELIGSDGFATALRKDTEASVARTVFIIGGPDGLGRAILEKSQRRISFGRMTLPHQLVRVILAEQLYRATTILSGHPYHRA
jgi:23S rRNA (pseudouridine1915-N3)-methyltransferase